MTAWPDHWYTLDWRRGRARDSQGLPRSGAVPVSMGLAPYPGAALDGGLGWRCLLIDGAGNRLWTQGPTGALYVWTPAQLQQSCSPENTPREDSFRYPTWRRLPLTQRANLWGTAGNGQVVNGHFQDAIFGYRVQDLQHNGAPSPAWALTGSDNPVGLAFDSRDYLWTGDIDALRAYSPATRLGPNDGGPDGSGPVADFFITGLCNPFCCDCAPSCEDDQGRVGYCTPPRYWNVAFDADGNLWASTTVALAESGMVGYSRSQVENAMADDQPKPSAYFRVVQQEGAGAIAFDQQGKLWVGVLDPDERGAPPQLFRYSVAKVPMDAGVLNSATSSRIWSSRFLLELDHFSCLRSHSIRASGLAVGGAK